MTYLPRILFVCSLVFLAGCGQAADPSSEEPANAGVLTFQDKAESIGVKYDHVATKTEQKLLPEIMGSGVAVADFNRDGAPDIIFANSGAVEKDARPAGSENKLFINDGKGVFADKSKEWALPSAGYGQGVAVGDFDNDGFIDVFLTAFSGDVTLLRNTGKSFEDVTADSGITSGDLWSTSAGFLDYDNDGDLDLFVVNYVDFTVENQHEVYRNKMRIYSTPIYYNPQKDTLWENQGNGKFVDATDKAGISIPGNGLALGIRDVDKDGDPDIYVANDSDANHLWLNNGGKFEDIAKISGCAYDEIGKEEGSMGVDFTDFDNDGRLDIAVSNFQGESTAIYRQTDDLLFEEVSDAVGVGETSRSRLSFGLDFFDADNDGDEDLLVVNGHIEDNVSMSSDTITFEQQNTLYLNNGDGKFTDLSDTAGNALTAKQVSRGFAVADFDNDGDLDFVVANNDGAAQVGINESKTMGQFAGFYLEGVGVNRDALGTRLVATVGDKKIEREITGAQSYMSVSEFRVLFGLGQATQIDSLEIYWAGGDKQVLGKIPAGRYYKIKQGGEPTEIATGK